MKKNINRKINKPTKNTEKEKLVQGIFQNLPKTDRKKKPDNRTGPTQQHVNAPGGCAIGRYLMCYARNRIGVPWIFPPILCPGRTSASLGLVLGLPKKCLVCPNILGWRGWLLATTQNYLGTNGYLKIDQIGVSPKAATFGLQDFSSMDWSCSYIQLFWQLLR